MFETEPRPDGLGIRFAASLPLLDRAVAETVAFLHGRDAAGTLFDVKLLLREALLNAVLHGCRSDPGCRVTLEVAAEAGCLTMRVADQGPGFDWRDRLANPPSPEATSGRGLTILTLYADDVRFNAAGNQVTLRKAVAGLRGPAMSPGTPGAEHPSRRNIMDDMRIEDGRTVYLPQGDIVASLADAMRARLRDIMHDRPGPLAIDLSRVELIDSVGIGLLIAVHNTLAKTGERLVLEKVNPDLAGLLRTMRLDKHFSIQTV